MTRLNDETGFTLASLKPMRFVIATLLALASTAHAELSMSVDRNPVRINETFVLDVKTDEVDADEPSLALPNGVELIRRNTISSRSIVNGKVNASRTWRYNLVARQAGEYVFPALTVGNEKAPPLSVSVLATEAKMPEASANQPIVLRASVDQKTVLTQQQVILTVQLLRNVPVRFAQLTEPQLPNALVQKLGDDSEYDTTLNGVSYLVIERRYAIFPQQAGELIIGPIHFQGDITNDRQLSLFGAFNESQPVSVQTQVISISVQNVPAADNRLPAQQLSLSDSISAEPYRAGEPLTWTVTVVADGVLPAQLPELAPTSEPQWRVYPDQPQDTVQVIATGVRTTRSQKFALVPTHAGEQTLPGLLVPWWRLADSSAQQATLPARSIRVLAASNAAPASAAAESRQTPTKTASDVTPTNPTPTADAALTVNSQTSAWWQWLTALFAALWLLTLALWWFSRRRRSGAAPATIAGPQAHEPGNSAALLDACKRHDAHAAQTQLLRHTGASSLGVLAQQHQGEIAASIEQLNNALYGPPPQRWRGDSLAALIPALLAKPQTSEQRKPPAPLPPLYPAA